MDIATITGAFEATKAAVGLLRGASAAVVDHAVKDKLIQVQEAILDIQAKLGDAQVERLSLLQEAAELRRRLQELEDARARLDAYELAELEPGKLLWRLKDGAGKLPRHYVCPNCFGEGRLSILQSGPCEGQTRYRCTVVPCRFQLLTGTPNPAAPARQVISPSYTPRNW
jgi:hypothetical protein